MSWEKQQRSKSFQKIPNVWRGPTMVNIARHVKVWRSHFLWQAQRFVRVGGAGIRFVWEVEGMVRHEAATLGTRRR